MKLFKKVKKLFISEISFLITFSEDAFYKKSLENSWNQRKVWMLLPS
jgi:hypothetical protein